MRKIQDSGAVSWKRHEWIRAIWYYIRVTP